MGKLKNNLRLWVQIAWTALSNGYVQGFVTGRIYTGKLKNLCVPGLNCYSCPGALGACPIGSLQAVLGSRNYRFSFYVIGFLILIGSLLGRFACGWLCPFGLVQDLLHKIPFLKKRKNLPGHKLLVWVKYLILVMFVILQPLFAVDIIGQGSPWFCKWICPSGTLTGTVLIAANEPLQAALGFLYQWKIMILVILLVLSVMIYRPFCKYLCPLGAIYGLFAPVSFYRIRLDKEKCVQCGKCQKVCQMDIRVWKTPNHQECIHCGDCVKACPCNALQCGFNTEKKR